MMFGPRIKTILMVLGLLVFAGPQSAQADNPVTVYIDGAMVHADVLPYMSQSGSVMVPISLLSDPCPDDYLWYSSFEKRFFLKDQPLTDPGLYGPVPMLERTGNHLYISLTYLRDLLSDPVTWDPIRRAVYIGDLPPTLLNLDKPMVALTFDDGPSQGLTERIVAALAQVDGRATFFMLGSNVAWQGDTAWMVAAHGHEIGNHSYSHRNMAQLSPQALAEDLARADEAILAATGQRPSLIRPTYGAMSSQLIAQAGRPLILWNIDPQDWRTKDAQASVRHVLDKVQDGDIVLMHDIHEPSIQATEELVAALDAQGYQLVTVSELIQARGMAAGGGSVVAPA